MNDGTPESGCRRRHFLRTVAGTAATGLALGSCGGADWEPPAQSSGSQIFGPRARARNPFVTADGRPVLVSVEGRDFARMLSRGLEALGGLQRLIAGGQDVLVKPNLNAAEEYPGISRPSSIAAVVREAKAVTTGVVSVGDDGFDSGPQVYSYLDLRPTVESVGGVLTTFSDTHRVRREGWAASRPDFHVYAAVYGAPVVINLCNLKRHEAASYTCAIKNNVGTVTGSGGEGTRSYLHSESDDFFGTLAEIAACINPELQIVDAQSVLTRNGPFVSWGVPVEANRLILCGDMVATDVYCCGLLAALDDSFGDSTGGHQVQRAVLLGLGEHVLSRVEILEITA